MNDFYISTKDLVEGYFFGRDKARDIIREVRREWEAKGFYLPHKFVAPRTEVLKKLGVAQ